MKRIQVIVEDWQAEMLKEFSEKHEQSQFVRECVSEAVLGDNLCVSSPKNYDDMDFKARKAWEASK